MRHEHMRHEQMRHEHMCHENMCHKHMCHEQCVTRKYVTKQTTEKQEGCRTGAREHSQATNMNHKQYVCMNIVCEYIYIYIYIYIYNKYTMVYTKTCIKQNLLPVYKII